MFEVLFIIAAVGFVLIRRMMGEQAEAKRMLVLPAILTVIGLSNSATCCTARWRWCSCW
jgi:hypothetical protein